MKKDDRVKYIGDIWPERVGKEGVVIQYNHPEFVYVRFDGEQRPVSCYETSLSVINAKT